MGLSTGCRVLHVQVDVDELGGLAAELGISSMPTFLFLKQSKVKDKLAGANIDAVKQKVDSLR